MYPETSIAHMQDNFARRFHPDGEVPYQVRPAEGNYGADLRHCKYCGSIHPEDLLKALDMGARLERADMKYGWPHKFYVAGIPNPRAGETIELWYTTRHEHGKEPERESHMGPAPDTVCLKFYNVHLWDLKDHPDLFEKVTDAIWRRTGVRFTWDERGLKWATGVPHPSWSEGGVETP